MYLHEFHKNRKAIFHKHDSYAALRQAFSSAWPNLHVELHYPSAKLDKEGSDEFEDTPLQSVTDFPNEVIFTLSDDTPIATATRLFSENYGGVAFILRDNLSLSDRDTLGNSNAPFTLPLDKFNYGEFKRRFTQRWPNLSVQLYDTAPRTGGLGQGDQELPDDFELKHLKYTADAFVQDYRSISDWGDQLIYIRISATIKNNKLGLLWSQNLRAKRFKDFQDMKE